MNVDWSAGGWYDQGGSLPAGVETVQNVSEGADVQQDWEPTVKSLAEERIRQSVLEAAEDEVWCPPTC